MRYLSICIIVLFLLTNDTKAITGYEQNTKYESGIYLNYSDLVNLSQRENPEGELFLKLEKQLNTPLIVQPKEVYSDFLTGQTLGNFFRVASWNIERGFKADLIKNIFENKNLPETIYKNKDLLDEARILKDSSIIILVETDIGLPRTHYENIPEKLAKSLMTGYAFGTEFVEVDPYQLGVKKFSKEERTFLEEETLAQLDNINTGLFHGLHGTAILSKYPILSAKIIRLPECYKWYKEEAGKLSALELLRRGAAQTIFSSKVLTELRHGGRIALVADILLPNKQTITVVGTHLENRCLPECRFKQFEFLLNRLRNINNPLIIGGDLNTTGTDASPTSLKKEVLKKVKDPEFLAKRALLSLTPVSLAQNLILNSANSLRQFKDPTTRNIPIILPKKERYLIFWKITGFWMAELLM